MKVDDRGSISFGLGKDRSLAVETGLTAYDSEFLTLARDLGVRMVTTDEAILKAAPREAVSPFRFS